MGGTYFHTHVHARQGCQACGLLRVRGTLGLGLGEFYVRVRVRLRVRVRIRVSVRVRPSADCHGHPSSAECHR